MREAVVVSRIKAQLQKHGAKVLKIHGDAYGEKGTPDLIGCYKGQFFALEVKAGNNKPTELQKQRLKEWEKVGAHCDVAWEDFDVIAFIEEIETWIKPVMVGR